MQRRTLSLTGETANIICRRLGVGSEQFSPRTPAGTSLRELVSSHPVTVPWAAPLDKWLGRLEMRKNWIGPATQHKLGGDTRLIRRRPDTSGDSSLLTWAARLDFAAHSFWTQ
jgi:hypothetical protein